jgi:hypothetical protein
LIGRFFILSGSRPCRTTYFVYINSHNQIGVSFVREKICN